MTESTSRKTIQSPANCLDLRLSILASVVRSIQSGNLEKAKASFDRFEAIHTTRTDEDLKYTIFGQAIAKRITKGSLGGSNLYLLESQLKQIDLFNLMGTRVPLISAARQIANEMILSRIQDTECPVLISIGIGTGRQEVELLHLLRQRGMLPRRLKVIGIDPADHSLQNAARELADHAKSLDIQIDFVPILGTIEDLSSEQWKWMKKSGGEIIVNAAFAMHHIRGDQGHSDGKDIVLQRVRELNPSLFMLTEPSSDHHTSDLNARFQNAWIHFGHVFDLVDELDLSWMEASAVKICFFAREIEDILASAESERTERHETAQMWVGRLKRCGFNTDSALPAVINSMRFKKINVSHQGHYMGLNFRDETIVGLMAAQSL